MKKALKFLDGKKTLILSVIAIVTPYLMEKAFIDNATGNLILQLSGLFLAGAQVATLQMNRKK